VTAPRPLRVSFLSSTPPNPIEGSGTFVALDGLLRGLARLGHDPRLWPLRLRTGFHTFDRWLYNGGVVLHPPSADVVVGVDLDGFMWARHRRVAGPRRATSRARVPYVITLKGVIADELKHERGWVRGLLAIQARWERINARRADVIVVPSAYSAAVASSVYGVPRSKFTVIPEPIDLVDWRARLAGAARRPRRRPTVLSVARLYPRKRLPDLLRAASRLRARIPDVQVRIVGGGRELDRLRALAVELDLGRTVLLLGEIPASALAVEYVSADCFCLPSVQEGFGIVFVEAMAAGLPVVACRAAAIPEVVEHGRTGILVTPERPDELADAIGRILEDRALSEELGTTGMKRVDRFDAERVAREWLRVLVP
jgi:phosphatidyl-myo-inositol dimannoside synthase